jgi:hypothetical protein
MSSYWKCSLCNAEIPLDDAEKRIERHNEFHMKARVQHRNTTQGTPEWTLL